MSLLLMSLTTFLTKQQMLITKAIFLLPSDCVKPASPKALTWEHKSWEWFAWPHKGNFFFFFGDLEFSGNVGNKKAVVKKPTVLTWFLLWQKCSQDTHDAVAPGEDRLGGRMAVSLSTGEVQRPVERLKCAPSGGCVMSSSLFNSWVLGKKYPASSRTLTFLFSPRWVSVAVGGLLSAVASLAVAPGLSGARASVVVAHRLSSAACVIFPDRGIEPVSPALAGGFLTTGPPGKPPQSLS